jgi:uncharacterized protein YkwD
MAGRKRIGTPIMALLVAAWLGSCSELRADTLWTEDAESGSGFVIDNTHASYSLIQSDVVGQGDFAFHLANPLFQDNSFVIDQTLTIESDTKLFFLSRLGYATTSQFARVQVSTNGGASWPTNIYSQTGAGTGTSGEGSFSLKEVDLSSFAGQNVRFRFFYEFTSGSAFTQVDPGVGWYTDNIQIGSEYEKIQYSIGDPTAYEQQSLEYLNLARADALVEANRLRDEPDSEIQDAYDFFEIEGQDIVDQFTWLVNNGHMDQVAQPLSFQPQLLQAAQLHTQDMFQNIFQGHTSSSNPPAPFQAGDDLGDRLDAVGYNFQSAAENVYSTSESIPYGHAGFDVDWGTSTSPGHPAYNAAFNDQGMQNPAGHRLNIHNGDFKEIGIGVINDTNGTVGPQLITQDFGYSGAVSYITGVVFEDLNENDFYDIGEGRSGVRVDVDGSGYYAVSSTSGGYSIPVTEDGMYEVTFSGGGFGSFATMAEIIDGLNVKVDYLALAGLLGDYNGDGTIDAADYTVWRDAFETGGTLLNDPTGGIASEDDYNYWRANFGMMLGSGSGGSQAALASVPEPSTLVLAGLLLLGFFSSRNRAARL